MKFYGVRVGRNPGVYETWSECEKEVKGFPNAKFKSFSTKDEALRYIGTVSESIINTSLGIDEQIDNDLKDGYLVAFTDGSYDKNINKYSYGVCLIESQSSGVFLTELCNSGNNDKYLPAKNIAGEVLGAINALEWAVSNNYKKIKIYHDYEGISKWINGEWKCSSPVSEMYYKVYENRFKDYFDSIAFFKVTAHSGIQYNDTADSLAKQALFQNTKKFVKGDNFSVFHYVSPDEAKRISELIKESDAKIEVNESVHEKEIVTKFKLYDHKLVTSYYPNTASRNFMIQGKISVLFQVALASVFSVKYNDTNQNVIDSVLKQTFRTSLGKTNQKTDYYFSCLNNCSNEFVLTSKALISSAISMLKLIDSVDIEDYGSFSFTALRSLEGYIKYLLLSVNITLQPKGSFSCFKKNQSTHNYYLINRISNKDAKKKIESCYNYYKSNRDSLFHFGDYINKNVVTTRTINSKDEAKEIIENCLNLIFDQNSKG